MFSAIVKLILNCTNGYAVMKSKTYYIVRECTPVFNELTGDVKKMLELRFRNDLEE